MVENPDAERMDNGIDNTIASQPLKSRENVYDFRDTPTPATKMTKTAETMSVRSPSSLSNTQTTKFGSQGSLRSAISLKDSTMSPVSPVSTLDKGSSKYSERGVDVESRASSNGRYDDSSRLITKSKENIVSTNPHGDHRPLRPIAANRSTAARVTNSSKTHLIDGIPQTEV